MIDLFGWLVVIVFIVLIIYSNTYWFRDIEKIAEEYAKELTDDVERWKKSAAKFPNGEFGFKEIATRSEKH